LVSLQFIKEENEYMREQQVEIDFEDIEDLSDYLEVSEDVANHKPILVQSEVLELQGFVSVTVGADHMTVPFEMLEEVLESMKKAKEKVDKYFADIDAVPISDEDMAEMVHNAFTHADLASY